MRQCRLVGKKRDGRDLFRYIEACPQLQASSSRLQSAPARDPYGLPLSRQMISRLGISDLANHGTMRLLNFLVTVRGVAKRSFDRLLKHFSVPARCHPCSYSYAWKRRVLVPEPGCLHNPRR